MSRLAALLLIMTSLIACRECDSNNPDPGTDAGADTDAEPGLEQPFDPNTLGWGLHVIARNNLDIYVAGGTPDRGVILHFDGVEWASEELPTDTPLVNWIGLFDGEMVAVGNAGTILWHDGGQWVTQDSPTTEDLWGVWGAGSDDVWAVGGEGRAEGQATVLRYDGDDWVTADVPELDRPGVNAFFKVWGTAADNVYIVGQNGACLHWDGVMLTEVGVGTSEDLISLWGTGPDDIVLVGGRGNGVLSHWNGASWYTASIAPAPGINGIWMPAPGEFWLAGVRGTLRRGTVNAGTDGERSFDVLRTKPLSEDDLHAVYGVTDYGLIAVGGNFALQDGPYVGLAFLRTEDWQ